MKDKPKIDVEAGHLGNKMKHAEKFLSYDIEQAKKDRIEVVKEIIYLENVHIQNDDQWRKDKIQDLYAEKRDLEAIIERNL